MPADTTTIVLTLLEARHFPRRVGYSLLIEARFDGELLLSDPVPHEAAVAVQNELAWALSKKALQQHRINRSPIKLTCFAINGESGAREMVGYIVLDLRAALPQSAEQWYPLLNTKYRSHKPELKMMLALENEPGAPPMDAAVLTLPLVASLGPPPTTATPSATPATAPAVELPMLQVLQEQQQLLLQQSRPVIVVKDGVCHVGSGTEQFTLSVTVAFLKDLEALVDGVGRSGDQQFFVYFSLLGVDVTTRPFTALSTPPAGAERATLTVRATGEDLAAVLTSSYKTLTLNLCGGDRVLASAVVSMHDLVLQDSGSPTRSLEGVFDFMPSFFTRLARPLPQIGVNVTLRTESGTPWPLPSFPARPTSASSTSSSFTQKLLELESAFAAPPLPRAAGPTDTASVDLSDTGPSIAAQAWARARSSPPSRPRSVAVAPPPASSLVRRFALSVDVRSVRNFVAVGASAARVFVRYTLPLFGLPASPVSTHPVEVPRNGERVFTAASRVFEFSSSSDQLSTQFQAVPVVAELVLTDRYASDEILGSATIFLTDVYRNDEAGALAGLPLASDKFYPVVDGATGLTVAELRVQLRLETRAVSAAAPPPAAASTTYSAAGPSGAADQPLPTRLPAPASPPRARHRLAAPPPVADSDLNSTFAVDDDNDHSSRALDRDAVPRVPLRPRAVSGGRGHHDPHNSFMTNTTANDVMESLAGVRGEHEHQAGAGSSAAVAGDLRHGPEYRAAVDLELWKRAEEDIFRAALQQKEDTLMRALAEEWRLRDAQREALTKRKVEEYTKLEEKLTAVLKDVEQRERKLVVTEDELSLQQRDLLTEHARKMQDLQDAARRLQQDMAHAVALERGKTAEAQAAVARAVDERQALEARLKKVEADFAKFRAAQGSSPEAQLQSEVTLLTRSVTDLERRLAAATQAKNRFKEQWTRALHEVGRLKTRERDTLQTHLRKEQQQLQQMRLQYLARDERGLHDRDQGDLADLKQQLQALRATVKAVACPRCQREACICALAQEDREALARLRAERDTLLQTGVYAQDDPIVQSLAQRIAYLEQQSDNSQ